MDQIAARPDFVVDCSSIHVTKREPRLTTSPALYSVQTENSQVNQSTSVSIQVIIIVGSKFAGSGH